MKKCMLVLLSLLILCSAVLADERGCPARRAANAGFQAIEEFHHILGPTWHRAWPAKDYDALFAAGPKFAEAFEGIAKSKPVFKSEARSDTYTKNRNEFAKVVKLYAEACEAKDKDKVYELMPKLHDAFEMTASSLLPIHYPQFDYFIAQLNTILENFLPQKNVDDITKATAELVERGAGLTEESVPGDLAEKKEAIAADLAVIKDLTDKMKECCEKKDMDNYKVHIEHLDTRVNEFLVKYI